MATTASEEVVETGAIMAKGITMLAYLKADRDTQDHPELIWVHTRTPFVAVEQRKGTDQSNPRETVWPVQLSGLYYALCK
jgi:hypothetical protein